jgi:hypothetical protein
MTALDFLKGLCAGYIRCYRTLNLHTSATWTDLTHRELALFARLGEMLGFVARLEHGRRDLSWHDPDSQALILYLERETDQTYAVSEALRKLLTVTESLHARYLVAVLGWVFEADVQEIKQRLSDVPTWPPARSRSFS